MRLAVWLLFTGAAFAADDWLARMEPVMTPQDRQRYTSLSNEEREDFRTAFWTGKAITPEEYFERVGYADATFGSGRAGSGANTDQGRVYIALGSPTQVVQLPSSRNLQPLEIWRYDHIPGIPVSSEVQLLFFRPRGVGLPKLYSPQLHTARALLINNAGTRGAFPINDLAKAEDLPNRLKLSPAELEAMDAAFSVARGVRGSGSSELLARVSNPAIMIRRDLRPRVESRIYTSRLTTAQSRTADRIPAVDLTFQTTVKDSISVEVLGIETAETKLNFEQPVPVVYRHRLYLLPGTWTIAITADSHRSVHTVDVHPLNDADPESGELVPLSGSITYRVNLGRDAQWVAIGRQYLKSGDLTRAMVCFRKALDLNNRNVAALAGYGRVRGLQNLLDEARSSLLKALELKPDDYESLVALAGVTARFQDHPRALEYYTRAQSIRDSADIQLAIRQLRAKMDTITR